jgi:hypothetical protein
VEELGRWVVLVIFHWSDPEDPEAGQSLSRQEFVTLSPLGDRGQEAGRVDRRSVLEDERGSWSRSLAAHGEAGGTGSGGDANGQRRRHG